MKSFALFRPSTLLVVAALVANLQPQIEAFLFGVSLTNAAGTVIGATNPVQTSALAGLGTLALAAGTALGGFLGRGRGRGGGGGGGGRRFVARRRPSRRYYYGRRRRSAGEPYEQQVQVLETAFAQMALNDEQNCFERVVCELSTGEGSSLKSSPLADLVRVTDGLDPLLSANAQQIRSKLKAAMDFGNLVDKADFCEEIYACPYSGNQIDKLISKSEFFEPVGGSFTKG